MMCRFVVIVALAVVLFVGCGDSGASDESTGPSPSLTTEEQAAMSRYVLDADHVNAGARQCAGATIVKRLGPTRLDELTKGGAATAEEADVLFDQFAKCVKWNGLVTNALLGDLRRTQEQAACVLDKGVTVDDAKPLAVAAFRRQTSPALSSAARQRYQQALAACIPGQ
jgi:hypothetical protein